jgi:hypothetical protein
MKRAASLSWIFNRDVLWLAWWQELIINWVASWDAIDNIQVASARTDQYVSWDVPTDLDLQRIELEQLLEAELEQR